MRGKRSSYILLLLIALVACSTRTSQELRYDGTNTPEVTSTIQLPTIAFTPTNTSAIQHPELVSTSTPFSGGLIGIGLRQQTIDILLKNKDCIGLTMAASSELAETYFPQLEGWIRVLGAPSLQALQEKAERARSNALPYEGLGYGLETSRSTPEEEWHNPTNSTNKAKNLANAYDKLLVMGPGFQLMSRNEDKYAQMAAEADIWIFQTQQLQKYPPGASYRDEVERIVNLIRTDHPDIPIWAQITLPPDREPDPEEWLKYRQLIADIVDGTYIGVYTWDTVENEKIIAAIESIFEIVCGGNSLR
jgi:hypothetical protein